MTSATSTGSAIRTKATSKTLNLLQGGHDHLQGYSNMLLRILHDAFHKDHPVPNTLACGRIALLLQEEGRQEGKDATPSPEGLRTTGDMAVRKTREMMHFQPYSLRAAGSP